MLIGRLSSAVGEFGAVAMANALAVGGSAVVFMDGVDLALKVIVAGLDVVIGATTVAWLGSTRKKRRLEIMALELELEERREKKAERAAEPDSGDLN